MTRPSLRQAVSVLTPHHSRPNACHEWNAEISERVAQVGRRLRSPRSCSPSGAKSDLNARAEVAVHAGELLG
jgi:hypothetical protein